MLDFRGGRIRPPSRRCYDTRTISRKPGNRIARECDPLRRLNPCVAPIEQVPFYAGRHAAGAAQALDRGGAPRPG